MADSKKEGAVRVVDSGNVHNVSVKDGRFQIKRSKDASAESLKAYSDRVKTGIDGLDRVMGGGFEKNSVNIVCGGPGTGKSIFVLQFLINGVEKFNEPGIYITFEEGREKTMRHMATLGWDLKKLEEENKLAIIEYTPNQVRKLLSEGGGEVDIAMENIKAKRIVIDSLSAFALLFKDELARMEAFLDLFKLIQRWDCTALLVTEDEQDIEKHHPTGVEFEVDGVILLYNLRKGDIRERALEILKLRGTEHSNKIFPMKITNRGVVVFPDETVF
ncbi:MAG: ATPase domain-containing protein [archaeon]